MISLKGWELVDGGFRQTQTLISAQWMLKGGPWIGYQLPVFGPPWECPIEFPLYQWCVILVHRLMHFPLTQSGRTVSLIAFALSLIPLRSILKRLEVSSASIWIILSIYTLSPIYLYYSRDPLIEVFTMSLGLAFLSAVIAERWCIAGVFGVLCALSKITTFIGFLFAAMLFLLPKISRSLKNQTLKTWIKPLVFSVGAPLAAEFFWMRYTQSFRELNPLLDFLKGEKERAWMFGTWEQRTQIGSFLNGLFFRRSVTDAIGQRAFLLICLPLAFTPNRFRAYFWGGLCVYLLTAFTFINVYSVHDYYPAASCIFIVGAIGLFIAGWLDAGGMKTKIGILLAALCLVGEITEYQRHWIGRQTRNDPSWNTFVEKIREATPKDSVLIIYGQDYSPSIPFSTERRALMDRNDRRPGDPEFEAMAARLSSYTLGGMVACRFAASEITRFYAAQIERFGFATEPSFAWKDDLEGSNCLFFGKR